MAIKTIIRPDDRITLTTEKQIASISTIERALGKIEGVAFVLDDRYSNPLLDAIEMLESAVKEITDGK